MRAARLWSRARGETILAVEDDDLVRARVTRELKVLFTSGYTENTVIHHGCPYPGVQLLNKPYRRQNLALKLRQVLPASSDAG